MQLTLAIFCIYDFLLLSLADACQIVPGIVNKLVNLAHLTSERFPSQRYPNIFSANHKTVARELASYP